MIVSSFLSANALAGLGDLQVKSHLGEPFQADINLVGFTAEELDNARIALASETEVRDPDAYSSRFLSSLRFTLLSSDQGGMIHISSNQPIDEPHLRFAIKIEALSKWQVREYNAFLSPNTAPVASPVASPVLAAVATPAAAAVASTVATPVKAAPAASPVLAVVATPTAAPVASTVTTSVQAAPVASPVLAAVATPAATPVASTVAAPVTTPAPVSTPPQPPAAETVVRSEPLSAPPAASKPEPKPATTPQQIRATRGASLWRLARQLKPANTSINQTMAALYLANKHAFVGGNPNRLKQGALLQLPDTSRIKAVSKGQIDKILHSDKLPLKTKLVLKPASKPTAHASGKTPGKPVTNTRPAPVSKPAAAQTGMSNEDLRIEELQKKLHSIDEALTKMDGLNKRIEKLQQQLKN
ncbi:FimV family protein [Aquitalea sp. ASV15]|uniref:type IV pilus assembly protein FimV n=1 Tax=Aquitalea sp. ASV15 TaxID=2795104 RepID=UPI0018EDE7CE|nr:FimV/HubP family polar landmark protein [Aquitalea sp. ASV15]